MTIKATVAIVGRPNVGKSTLFNRLVGRRQAIVHDLPGVTRDRITGETTLGGRPVHLIDTGGLQMTEDILGLNDQVFMAAEESDLLLLMVDGKEGRSSGDEEVLQALRRYGKPTVLVVNKSDAKAAQSNAAEFYGLGIPIQVLVSAEHGLGMDALHDAVEELLPEQPEEEEGPDLPALAIVGRPNVGKSSLLNRFVGVERALVSPIAGTTRDPVDSILEVGGVTYRLIDTAGIRRRSQVTGEAEGLAVMMARRQLERAELALLVVDASAGITTGDLAIAGAAWDFGRAMVILVNKWDLIDENARRAVDDSWPRLAELAFEPERVNLSAETGRSLDKVFPAVERARAAYRITLTTSEVNRIFQKAVARHHAPADRGKPWNLLYATQVKTGPPTFVLFANRSLPKSSSYRRYLENFLRRELGLSGVPIRLKIKVRSRRGSHP